MKIVKKNDIEAKLKNNTSGLASQTVKRLKSLKPDEVIAIPAESEQDIHYVRMRCYKAMPGKVKTTWDSENKTLYVFLK